MGPFRQVFQTDSMDCGADNIVVMEDGQVAEQGMHGQLLGNRGAYYRLGLVSFIISAILLAVSFLILHNMEFQGESLLEIFTAPMLGYFRGIL